MHRHPMASLPHQGVAACNNDGWFEKSLKTILGHNKMSIIIRTIIG